MNTLTEIMQNMSATTLESVTLEGDIVVTRRKAGDFVVCNLSSIHLGNVFKDDVLERLIPIQVRMLDNTIDNNELPLEQAKRTNLKYRSIGLGAFSYHHWLALNRLHWGSPEAIEATDKLYEKIAYLTIKASHEIAKEKGTYEVFEGSDWHNGEYFTLRGYDSPEWLQLKDDVATYGIRNAYLMSPAPNGQTSVLTNGTAAADPIYDQFYYEEKKDSKHPVVVPDLNPVTNNFYNNAYTYDPIDSILQGAVRQKHIDQSQSFNIYVDNNIQGADLLNIHMTAWKNKFKTTYYVRSTNVSIIECQSCSS